MEIAKKQLLEAVQMVLPGIDKKSNFTGSDCIMFDNNTVKTFNDFVGFSMPIIDTNIKAAVKADDLIKILKKCKKDIIEVIESDKSIDLKAGRVKASLHKVSTENLEDRYSEFVNKEYQSIPDKLLSSIESVFIPKNNTDYEGVFIHKNGIVCTDNLRINRITEKIIFPDTWIPTNALSIILKQDVVQYAQKENFIIFKTDTDFEIITKTYPVTEYPFERLMSIFDETIEKEHVKNAFMDDIFESIDQMAITETIEFDKGIWNDAVRLTLSGKDVIIHSDTDSVEMSVSAHIESEMEGEFIISLGQLKKALENNLQFSLIENTLYFQSNNMEYLVIVA